MTDYVFDTEPLVAYLYDEPGAEAIGDRLATIRDGEATGSLAHATAAELVYTVARLETGDPMGATPDEDQLTVARRDLRALQGIGLSIEVPSWQTVARLKAPGGLSLGDAYGAALAMETDATFLVGADPEFGALDVELTVERVVG